MIASHAQKWLRRSRLAAREFATTKRLDTFCPATGARVQCPALQVFADDESSCREEFKRGARVTTSYNKLSNSQARLQIVGTNSLTLSPAPEFNQLQPTLQLRHQSSLTTNSLTPGRVRTSFKKLSNPKTKVATLQLCLGLQQLRQTLDYQAKNNS